MSTELLKEHRWLERLVGDWTYETDATTEPGKAPGKFTGTERVRSIGGAWVVCEGTGSMPGGDTATTLMTLGYDPAKRRYVGTHVGSMMTYLWIYEGRVDASGRALMLSTEGPSFADESNSTRYEDVMAFESDDYRVMRSRFLGEDGAWREIMATHYRRAK